MQVTGCSYEIDEAYERLDKLGIKTERLRALEPTLFQLNQILTKLSSIHDKKLLKFLASILVP